jgi:hypothetical protein
MIVIADDKCGNLVNRVALDAPPELEQLQGNVGGFIELIPAFNAFEGKPCVAFCNEEGKLRGLQPNSKATVMWEFINGKSPRDCLVGPVVILTGDKEFMEAL